jgi:hypothetical protein
MRQAFTWIIVSILILAGGGVWWLQATPPADDDDNQIVWSVPKLSATLFPGTSSTTVVTFRSTKALGNVVIEPTPSLNGILSVSPASFTSIAANQSYRITFTIKAPPEFKKHDFGGTIHIRNDGKPSKTFAPPLNVGLTTDFAVSSNPALGAQFAVPLNMVANMPSSDSTGVTVYVHDVTEEFPGGGITITRYNNTTSLASVLNQIAVTLTLVSQATLTSHGQSWTINTYIDPKANQQFVDAFTVVNGSVYQVGGLASFSVKNLLPALLNSIGFL